MRKLKVLVSAVMVMSLAFGICASADGIESAVDVTTSPSSSSDSTLVYTPASSAVIGPSGSYTSGSSSSSILGPGGSSSYSYSQASSFAGGSLAAAAAASEAGADHASDAKTSIDLGFTVVSPAYSHLGFEVAEGSVQLSDGSWAEISHDMLIRAGYFRLLRETTDSTGTAWYIVRAHASQIGDYFTPDGSVATELWLKKSECSASSSFELNTSNQTRQNIVRTALSLLGDQYVYGASGPDTFDCSGFVYYVLSQNGISVSRTSAEICAAGTEVGIRGLRPGDIVGRDGHVGIYIGGDWFVHASLDRIGVIAESVAVYNESGYPFTNYRNVVGD